MKLQHRIGRTGLELATSGLLMVGALATPGYGQDVAAVPVGRVKIATNYVQAKGCHDETQTFTTQIPAAARLDRSYHGVVDGIEIVEVAANNGHAYRNVIWTNNGNAVTYQLYAKGRGYWIDPPKVFGVNVGGGYCHDAAGGSEGVEVYAHYKPQ